MVPADLVTTISTIRDIIILLAPVIALILIILVKKGIVTKDQAEKAEKIIRVLTSSIETFKGDDKPASKLLTELIDAKATGERVKEELTGYLNKYNLNLEKEK